MRKMMVWIILCLCLGMNASGTYGQIGDFYYSKNGDRVYVPVSDSLILVKHDPNSADVAGEIFAASTAFLNDEFTFLESTGSFYLYHIADEYSFDDAVIELWQMEEVDFVSPVLADCHGSIHLTFVTNQFIANFHSWVSEAVIDSLNNYYCVLEVARDPDFETQYLLETTAKTKKDALVISQKYYESGLCLHAAPNFVARLIPLFEPDDPYFSDQWHLRNNGQQGGVVDADIDADGAWEITSGDDAVIVACCRGAGFSAESRGPG